VKKFGFLSGNLTVFLKFVLTYDFIFSFWQKECEELHKKMEILKDENSVLTQRLKSLSEECLEICNENDAIEVHHLNFIAYLVVFV